MDASDRIEFVPVTAAGYSIHCYLDRYYIARICIYADSCNIDGAGFKPMVGIPNTEEAKEVVRMMVRWRTAIS